MMKTSVQGNPVTLAALAELFDQAKGQHALPRFLTQIIDNQAVHPAFMLPYLGLKPKHYA